MHAADTKIIIKFRNLTLEASRTHTLKIYEATFRLYKKIAKYRLGYKVS